jgi:hypothetical protein
VTRANVHELGGRELVSVDHYCHLFPLSRTRAAGLAHRLVSDQVCDVFGRHYVRGDLWCRTTTAQQLKPTLGLVKISGAVVLEATRESVANLRGGIDRLERRDFWGWGVVES